MSASSTSKKASSANSDAALNTTARMLAAAFCDRTGIPATNSRIKYVAGRYFKCLKYHWRLTPDRIILYDIKHNTYTSDRPYVFDGLIYRNGKLYVLWSETQEPLQNINLGAFENFEEFRKCFIGELDEGTEKIIKEYWDSYHQVDEASILEYPNEEEEEENDE